MFSLSKNDIARVLQIYSAPADEYGVNACRKTDCGVKKAAVQLGRTLPSLLDEGCEFGASSSSAPFSFLKQPGQKRSNAPVATINQYRQGQWQSWTLVELKRAAEEIALGLQQYKWLLEDDSADNSVNDSGQESPRAVLLMDSDVSFVMADLGCILARAVTVPASPEQSLASSEYILRETAARLLFVSRLNQVEQLLPNLSSLNELRLIVVANTPSAASAVNSEPASASYDKLAALQWSLPHTVDLITLDALRGQAKWTSAQSHALNAALHPQDLATIVYTLSGSGRPLGAMLTHENLSGNVLAAFSTLPCLRKGASEVALSFLPLHHIFARGFVYGSLAYGQSLYFSSPRLVMKHLRELQPTVFFAVPRLLEKVYEGWQSAPERFTGPFRYPQQLAFAWAQNLAKGYRLDSPPSLIVRAQLWVARQSVFRPLRNLFGGRLECFISGGAALPAEVMTLLSAAGLRLCQGYGLTEASSTVSFTRRQWSRAGTVGVPMPGVEMAIAPDGEVLLKAPYVMQGYYAHPEATRAVLEPDGWLHTGDRGEFSADGLLTLTGYKKALFKLSIGEYVAPEPTEQALRQSSLVQQALVVGPGRKFCGLLIFPNMTALVAHAQRLGLSAPGELLINHPQMLEAYQMLINQVNADLPGGATIKRFQLIDAELTVENEGLTPAKQLNREALYSAFAEDISQLYRPIPSQSLARAINAPATSPATVAPQSPSFGGAPPIQPI